MYHFTPTYSYDEGIEIAVETLLQKKKSESPPLNSIKKIMDFINV